MIEVKQIPLLREVRKKTNSMPFWYDTCPDDPKMMQPNEQRTALLEEALANLNAGLSLREVSDWITETSGLKLSHMGLSKIWTRVGRERNIIKPVKKPKRTMAEHKEIRRKIRIRSEKNRVNNAIKRIERLGGEIQDIRFEEEMKKPLKGIVEVDFLPEEGENPNIIFKPNAGPQTEFLASEEQEVLYGGAAGGELKSGFFRLLFS